MTVKNKILFCALLTKIAELYGKPLSADTLEIYWNALEKFSLESVRRAVHLHVTNTDTGQFMPKPADILRYIEMNHEIKALHAWDKVVSAMREVGAYDSVIFDDPIIHIIVNEMGGWVALCHIGSKELPFKEIEFQRRYSIYLVHPMPTPPKQLCGITEHQNLIGDYIEHIPKPVLVGKNKTTLMIEDLNLLEKDDYDR